MITEFAAHVCGMSPLAYIDGGTGSMLLQAALAGLLAALYVVKTRFAQLRAMFSRLGRGKYSTLKESDLDDEKQEPFVA